MSATSFFWFLPSGGDGRYLVSPVGRRPITRKLAQQIATAVDNLGYDGMLLPTGAACEDAWITASTLIPLTERLKFLVAIRPGLITAPVSAQMAATFDRFSDGRLLVNVVAGGNTEMQKAEGMFLDHSQRYAQTDEYLTVWRKLLSGETVNFHGEHVQVENARLNFKPVQRPHPPVFFGGSSEAGIRVAAKHADTYLTWGEPPAMVEKKVAEVRKAAAAEGRTVKFGIRLHVVVRDTEAKAWEAANDLLRDVDDNVIAKYQAALGQGESEGQKRMLSLHGGRRDNLEISPNLWAGVGLVRSGAGTALVGDGKTVAARIAEYRDIGFETFVLSGYPHLEEAYRFAEDVIPIVRQQESAQAPAPLWQTASAS
ncbi:MAG: FMNH2-dependent alkanesulfonate monooxygenase [Parvibaculaceae bacterium]|nr:FMNH2-dependent alkanesulfonate monooxygenase [Parvibaculaceae bacterium]